MKETFKDILPTDFIEKTRATFQDMVSGVKNLFRVEPEKARSNPDYAINNHLKSQDEMEKEFKSMSMSQTTEDTSPIQGTIIVETSAQIKFVSLSEEFPEYMEENY
ncbi:MAG: hypothetical protein QM764_12255 [Chitinophagaceae bacterium]